MWLLPTFALFVTSLMTPQDYNSFGWWKLLSDPSLATWQNYSNSGTTATSRTRS